MRDYSATLTKVFDKTRNTHNESPETKHSIKLIETIRTNAKSFLPMLRELTILRNQLKRIIRFFVKQSLNSHFI